MYVSPARLRFGLMASALTILGACDDAGRLDFDLRDNLGTAFDTSPAIRNVVARPPRPDDRGIVSYPGYQVAVARAGDTVDTVAARIGLPAQEIARFNGLPRNVALRRGEIIALPRRVAEPSPATGAPVSGPIRPAVQTPGFTKPGAIATTSLEDRATTAIRRAETADVQTGTEPVRHRVARGETAFSIARRYGVPVEALGEWNGLGDDLSVREGQYLLIPTATEAPAPRRTAAPGVGSVAPAPPSAITPLPEEEATQDPPEDTPDSPNLAAEATSDSASDARLALPVSGPIIRPFSKGSNEGIDIAAEAGTPVAAADAGVVAAITRDTDQVPIVVLRHAGNLLTVYAGVDQVSVEKGDQVSRGQPIARIRQTSPSFLHFEVREGFDSVDPVTYLE